MDKLLEKLNWIKNTMTAVSTGGQRIENVNEEYIKVFREVNLELKQLGVKNPNPYTDLWEWYAKWSKDLPQYRDRRAYVIELFKELFQTLDNHPNSTELNIELYGWERIERSISEIKVRLAEANSEEQYQVVGLLCRETIISLAQEVYDSSLHPSLDGVEPSETDSKRMLDAYISVKLPGSDNENLRRYAKATNALSNELTHKRTATLKLAKLCSSSCINLVNLIRILEE
ncbi:MAG: hypothetical protein O9340_10480 [Cyclobacteriaceae bacterium]|nr:hypothetical protein [Cyclobacteriaceae bacterium]